MIPFHLVTGFLGSGKTTFLKEFLAQYGTDLKVAVIQNEFADAGIDGKELKDSRWSFDLLEVNKGSVFCVCLFSEFREQLRLFVDNCRPDIVLLEATGMADPMAISELLMDNELQKRVFLAKIWTIADALHFDKVRQMPAVKNQLLIADEILLNKSDLVNAEVLQRYKNEILEMNPTARITATAFCRLDQIELPETMKENQFLAQPNSAFQGIRSQVYRTPYKIKQKNLDYLISQLNEEIYRLKGYVWLDDNKTYRIQSVFGVTTLTEMKSDIPSTEIISIGTKVLDFELMLRKMVFLNLKAKD